MAQGLPGSPGWAVSALLRPLRWARPTGWIGGRYTTSNPIAAARSSCASASLNVPCRPSPPLERGKNSYQAAKRARSRSAITSNSRPARVAATVEEERHQHVVALLEDVGAHLEHGADLALDRIAAAVDVRRDRLDHHGAAQIGGRRQVASRPGRRARRGGRAGFLPDGKPGLARGRQ